MIVLSLSIFDILNYDLIMHKFAFRNQSVGEGHRAEGVEARAGAAGQPGLAPRRRDRLVGFDRVGEPWPRRKGRHADAARGRSGPCHERRRPAGSGAAGAGQSCGRWRKRWARGKPAGERRGGRVNPGGPARRRSRRPVPEAWRCDGRSPSARARSRSAPAHPSGPCTSGRP